MENNKIKLGECPYCQSINYERNDYLLEEDFFRVNCCCSDCQEEFVEYFSIDEVKFEEDGEEHIYNNALFKHEKETIIKAINVLIQVEGDTTDYSRIINVMNGGVNEDE